ncbi:T9SS type A sorting domain-containing protein [uncultured Hymenobacter sp.]|uniref:T9SS type A sorting domain-containing protein n=1 Tax=uncultured Hymenobacter sp. TaxID=170016 RepID=UPI0035CBB9C9
MSTDFLLFSAFKKAQWILTLLLLSLIKGTSCAQAPAWQMAIAVNQTNPNGLLVNAATTDTDGNVYIVGRFSGTATFSNSTITGAGSWDMFVAKWSPSSNSFLWAQAAGGRDQDEATAVAVNGTNIYVTGIFNSATASFGGAVITAAGGDDVFVTKLIDAGASASFSWVQQAGGLFGDYALSLAVSGTSVYVAGQFGSTATFGNVSLTATRTEAFVAKLTDSGTTGAFIWARSAGGIDIDQATAVAVEGTSVYLAGSFQGTATFGSITLRNNDNTRLHTDDIFVAKLTDGGSTGEFTWALAAGGSALDRVSAIAVSGPRVFITGAYYATANFGGISLTNTGVNNHDMFVAKLVDAGGSGSFVWVQSAVGASSDGGDALVVSGATVYAAGTFYSSTILFGATTLTSSAPSNREIFVTKLFDAGTSGDFVWAQQASSAGLDDANAIALSGTRVYVAGNISPVGSFGAHIIPQVGFPSPQSQAGFLASLTDADLLPSSSPALSTALTVFPNPAHTSVTVRIPAIPGSTQAVVTLIDVLGRPARTHDILLPTSTSDVEVPLSGLIPGLYHLRLQAGNLRLLHTLLVE